MSFIAFLKSLASVKAILDYASAFIKWASEMILKFKINQKNKKVEDAADKLRNATTPEAKAEAACELEKLGNPDSDCK